MSASLFPVTIDLVYWKWNSNEEGYVVDMQILNSIVIYLLVYQWHLRNNRGWVFSCIDKKQNFAWKTVLMQQWSLSSILNCEKTRTSSFYREQNRCNCNGTHPPIAWCCARCNGFWTPCLLTFHIYLSSSPEVWRNILVSRCQILFAQHSGVKL